MKPLSTLAFWKLRFFSKPVGDRALYQWIAKAKPGSILEIGLTSIERSMNLIRVSQKFSEMTAVKYCGIDLFDGRATTENRLSLKDAHRELHKTNAKIRLLPGDFCSAIPRLANQLGKHDLIIVRTIESAETLAPVWYYVPRLLHDYGTLLLRANTSADIAHQKLSFSDVSRLAEKQESTGRQAA